MPRPENEKCLRGSVATIENRALASLCDGILQKLTAGWPYRACGTFSAAVSLEYTAAHLPQRRRSALSRISK